MLLGMVDTIETEHKKAADDLGLSETEFAFYGVLEAEVMQGANVEVLDEAVLDEIKATTQALVAMFEEATKIVDFFSKPDEIKGMKKKIKHAVLDCSFGDKALVAVVQDRFMDLGKVKFKS